MDKGKWGKVRWKKAQSWGSTYPHCWLLACPHATYSINSEASARTSNPLLLLCLEAKDLLGFLMTSLNLKLVSALISFLFLFFNFSLAFSTLSICRDKVEFILVLSLTCSFRILFSFFMCLLSISSSYLSLLNTSISDSGGLGVLSLLSEALLSKVST